MTFSPNLFIWIAGFRDKNCTAYDSFRGNGLYHRIPTNHELIRTLGFTSGLPCHIIQLLGLYKIWTAKQSIPVIHFATLFLPLDIRTPPSSLTSGKYSLFYFNFGNVKVLHWFLLILFFTIKKLFTLPLCFYPKISALHHLHWHQARAICFISIFSMSVLEQILNLVQTYIRLHWFWSVLF